MGQQLGSLHGTDLGSFRVCVTVVELDLFVGFVAVRSDLSLALQLVFWKSIPYARLTRPALMQKRRLVLPQLDRICFVDCHGKPAPF